jgi:membrane associated rhomboid family serine protease
MVKITSKVSLNMGYLLGVTHFIIRSCRQPRAMHIYSLSKKIYITQMEKIIIPQYRSSVINTIIMLNIAVFILWMFSAQFQLFDFMVQNFLVSWTAIKHGRFWVIITTFFSHNALFHLFINMFVLNSFGPIMVQALGKKSFLVFYFMAGICGSLTHALVSAFLIHQPDLPALGASGAIAGLILLFALLFPKEKILLLGIIPVGAIWGALILVGVDVWGLVAQTQGGGLPIGHGAHLGGAMTGILYYLVLRAKGHSYIL